MGTRHLVSFLALGDFNMEMLLVLGLPVLPSLLLALIPSCNCHEKYLTFCLLTLEPSSSAEGLKACLDLQDLSSRAVLAGEIS